MPIKGGLMKPKQHGPAREMTSGAPGKMEKPNAKEKAKRKRKRRAQKKARKGKG